MWLLVGRKKMILQHIDDASVVDEKLAKPLDSCKIGNHRDEAIKWA